MNGTENSDAINELSKSFLKRYQEELYLYLREVIHCIIIFIK